MNRVLCRDTASVGLTAVIAEQSYNLNDRVGILLEAYGGLGVQGRRLAQRGPGQSGDTDLGFVLDPRYLDLAWRIVGRDKVHYYELRETLLTIWQPASDPVQLIFEFAGGKKRAVDVFLDGELDFPPGGRDYTTHRFSGIFKAPDQRLYHPTLKQVAFSLAAGTGGLPVPFTIPVPIGGSSLNVTHTITYASNSRLAAAEFPIVTIIGQITNPVLEQLTTDEQIDLSANGGLIQTASGFVVIDLSGKPRRDSKTIRDQNGNSIDQYLSTSSDLETWHLAPAGEKLYSGKYNDGSNVIRVRGENTNVATRVTIDYYDRYKGV